MVKSDVQEKSYGKSKFHTFVKRIFGTSKGDRTFHIINYLLFLIVGVVSFYPFWYCIQTSFIANLNDNGVPREIFSFSAYIAVFETSGLMQSFFFFVGYCGCAHGIGRISHNVCSISALAKKSSGQKSYFVFYRFYNAVFWGNDTILFINSRYRAAQ